MGNSITANDERSRRCPMLGHPVPFAYCRAPGTALPCRRIFDCWWETFDVVTFIRSHYAERDVEQILAPATAKTSQLMQLIEKAKNAASTD